MKFNGYKWFSAAALFIVVGFVSCWSSDDNDQDASEDTVPVQDMVEQSDTSSVEDSVTGLDTNVQTDVSTGEGTWTDSNSGLMWQTQASETKMFQEAAVTWCDELVLGSHDDWRLPTVSELRSLIRGCEACETGGSCNIEDGGCLDTDCRDVSCDGCAINEGPADDCYWPDGMEGLCHFYWTATGVEGSGTYNWTVQFWNANITNAYKFSNFSVRCVR